MTSFIRELTDDEIASFRERGWAHLPRLIGEESIAVLRARAERRLEQSDAGGSGSAIDAAFGQDRDIADADEKFRDLAHSAGIGAAARRLLGAGEVRLQITNLLVKHQQGTGRHDAPTVFHQDFPWMPMDRSVMLTFWVALAPITAEMGSLRFRDGSHHAGLLGRSFVQDRDDLPSVYPWLADLPLVGGFDLEPGDATVHHALTVHGAPANTGDSPRLSFAATYFDAATLYTGAPYTQTDQLQPALDVNQAFDHPRFPLVPAGR